MTVDEKTQVQQEIKQILERSGNTREKLIPILQEIQQKLGYLPREAMEEVARGIGISRIEVYGVITFYNQFRLNPPGKHSIRVCLGTACHMKGGHISLDAWKRRLNIGPGETTADREFDLDTVACVGCCTMAPVSVVDGKPDAKVDPTKVDGLLLTFEQKRQKREENKNASG